MYFYKKSLICEIRVRDYCLFLQKKEGKMSYKLYYNKEKKNLFITSTNIFNESDVLLFETYEDAKIKNSTFTIPESNFTVEVKTIFKSYKVSKQLLQVSIESDGYSFVDFSRL